MKPQKKARDFNDSISKTQCLKILTLSLLVTWIRITDHTHYTLASNDLAISADLFYRCSYFHLPTPKRTALLACAACTSIILEVGFLHDRIVLMRHHMALYLRHKIHHNNNDNQQ